MDEEKINSELIKCLRQYELSIIRNYIKNTFKYPQSTIFSKVSSKSIHETARAYDLDIESYRRDGSNTTFIYHSEKK